MIGPTANPTGERSCPPPRRPRRPATWRRVAAFRMSQDVRVWDVSTGKEFLRFAPPRKQPGPSDPLSDVSWFGRVGFVAYSPDGKLLAAGGERVVVADAATGKEVAVLADD